jgi:hypothetical protein
MSNDSIMLRDKSFVENMGSGNEIKN